MDNNGSWSIITIIIIIGILAAIFIGFARAEAHEVEAHLEERAALEEWHDPDFRSRVSES